MPYPVLEYSFGVTKGNITVTNKLDDGTGSAYDASWANTTNTTIKIVEEYDYTIVADTLVSADLVSISSTQLIFKKSALSAIPRGLYVARILYSDGTDTEELRYTLKIT